MGNGERNWTQTHRRTGRIPETQWQSAVTQGIPLKIKFTIFQQGIKNETAGGR